MLSGNQMMIIPRINGFRDFQSRFSKQRADLGSYFNKFLYKEKEIAIFLFGFSLDIDELQRILINLLDAEPTF